MNGPNPTSSCKIPQLGLQQKNAFFAIEDMNGQNM
jgi:hypothetical protein